MDTFKEANSELTTTGEELASKLAYFLLTTASLFCMVMASILISSTPAWASRIDTTLVTPEAALEETCLDRRTVEASEDIESVRIDERGWHNDNRLAEYGQHVTAFFERDEVAFDTVHIYQEKNDDDNCLVTFGRWNYGGYGTPVGDGSYQYFRDTYPD